MARPAAPPSQRPKGVTVYLPIALLEDMDSMLPRDPLSGKIKHGARSTFIESAVRAEIKRLTHREQETKE